MEEAEPRQSRVVPYLDLEARLACRLFVVLVAEDGLQVAAAEVAVAEVLDLEPAPVSACS